MRIMKSVIAATLLLQTSVTLGAMAYRIATIDEIQTESSTRAGFENIMYIHQSASWLLTNNCPASYAYFNAKENPHFVATILAARVSERPLKVVVDDSLARISGFCQIVNVSL